MPVPPVRRVVTPQPPPPPVVRIIPAHPQPPQQQAAAVQTQMVGIPPTTKPQGPHPKQVKQASRQQGGQQHGHTPAAQSADVSPEKCATTTTSTGLAPGSPQQTRNIELVYHGRFAPIHLGHLAVVEAAVTLVKAAMKPAVVTTWISMASAKHLPVQGDVPDPVLRRYAHGPYRCSMIDAVCSTSEYRIHIIPREFATAEEMFQHVQLKTPHHIHIYLEGSNLMLKLVDKKVTVWRDPNKNLTQFVMRRLAGTAVQRAHHGISSTQVRRAIIDKDWQKVTQMCGEAAMEEARRMVATIPLAEFEHNEGRVSDRQEAAEEADIVLTGRPYPVAVAAAASPQPPHTTSKAAGAHPCAAIDTGPAAAPPTPAAKPDAATRKKPQAQPQQTVSVPIVQPIDLSGEMPDQTQKHLANPEAAPMPASGAAGPVASTQTRAASAPPDKRKATMESAQPEPKKSKAGGVYAAWRKQGMSPSAIITLAAEVQLLAAQLSEKSDVRLHVLRVARALIAAHDCLRINTVTVAGEQMISSPGARAPSVTSRVDTSDDSSSSSSNISFRGNNAGPDRLAQDAIHNRDFSMQMASDIISRLPLTQ
eukprot:185351-Amphidinium_carterae.1